jgi:hypothetical protein
MSAPPHTCHSIHNGTHTHTQHNTHTVNKHLHRFFFCEFSFTCVQEEEKPVMQAHTSLIGDEHSAVPNFKTHISLKCQ